MLRLSRRRGESALANPTHLGVPMYGNGLHLPMRPNMVHDILERLRCENPPPADDVFLVDWAGVRTRIAQLPWAPQELAGTTSDRLPIPTDGYRSEADEYAALALSLVNERDEYRVIEVGAGWAPWAVMGTTLAKRMGKRAHGIAVEADGLRSRWAAQHAADNGLDVTVIDPNRGDVSGQLRAEATPMAVVRAAAWHEKTTLRFPVIDDLDMGGAVNPGDHPTMDNRGAHFNYVSVPTVTLDELIGDEIIDLLHIDLQGFELDVIIPALELIESRVRFLAVGTHNRYVEGMLQHTLMPREWALILESPCTAIYDGVKPTLTGFTVQDGNQVYANSRFRDGHPMIIRDTWAP